MLLLIIFLIIGGFLSYNSADESYPFAWDRFIFGILFTGVAYFIILGFIRVAVSENLKNYYYEYKDQPIESLINKKSSSISGSFILGCGSISGGSYDYYVAYANFPQGALRIKIDAYNTYVQENNNESPRIKNYWVRKNRVGYKSLWIWNREPSNGNWIENDQNFYFNTTDKIVIVPKNTIYKEFLIKD